MFHIPHDGKTKICGADFVDRFDISGSSSNLAAAGVIAKVKQHRQLDWDLRLSARVRPFLFSSSFLVIDR